MDATNQTDAKKIDAILWDCIGKKGRRKMVRYWYKRLMESKQ